MTTEVKDPCLECGRETSSYNEDCEAHALRFIRGGAASTAITKVAMKQLWDLVEDRHECIDTERSRDLICEIIASLLHATNRVYDLETCKKMVLARWTLPIVKPRNKMAAYDPEGMYPPSFVYGEGPYERWVSPTTGALKVDYHILQKPEYALIRSRVAKKRAEKNSDRHNHEAKPAEGDVPSSAV